jgi:hypothetical protein
MASALEGYTVPHLKGHLKGNHESDDLPNNVARRFSTMGYPLDV